MFSLFKRENDLSQLAVVKGIIIIIRIINVKIGNPFLKSLVFINSIFFIIVLAVSMLLSLKRLYTSISVFGFVKSKL